MIRPITYFKRCNSKMNKRMSPQILAQILRDGKIVDQNIVKLKWLACFEKKNAIPWKLVCFWTLFIIYKYISLSEMGYII